jgi:hypothetical protein
LTPRPLRRRRPRFIPHNNFTSFSPSLYTWYNLIMRGHMHLPSIVRCFSYLAYIRADERQIQLFKLSPWNLNVYTIHRAAYFIDPLSLWNLFAGTKVDVNSFVTFSVISRQCKCFPSMASQLT